MQMTIYIVLVLDVTYADEQGNDFDEWVSAKQQHRAIDDDIAKLIALIIIIIIVVVTINE